MAEDKPFHERTHPKHDAQKQRWHEARVSVELGEAGIKAAGTEFLPRQPGMIALESMGKGAEANERYAALKLRAEYPGLPGVAVQAAAGMMTDKPAVHELGTYDEPMAACATPDGDTLDDLHMLACEEVCTTGGGGLIVNIDAKRQCPLLVHYQAEQIVNWRYEVAEGKRVLAELVLEREENGRTERVHYELGQRGLVLRLWVRKPGTDAKSAVWEEAEIAQPRSARPLREEGGLETVPTGTGSSGYRLPFIPFVWLRARSRGPDDKPCRGPFDDLIQKCLSAYRQDALHKECLSLGEPTPVFIGPEGEPLDGETSEQWQARYERAIENLPRYTGLGAQIVMPRGARVESLEYRGHILDQQRQTLNDTLRQAQHYAAMPFEQDTRQVESGEAKRERRVVAGMPLKVTAKSVGSSIERAIRLGARWLGMTEAEANKLTFKPDLDFGENGLPPQLMVAINGAVAQQILSRDSAQQLYGRAGFIGLGENGQPRTPKEESALADGEVETTLDRA